MCIQGDTIKCCPFSVFHVPSCAQVGPLSLLCGKDSSLSSGRTIPGESVMCGFGGNLLDDLFAGSSRGALGSVNVVLWFYPLAFAERRERSFSRSWSDPTPIKADSFHDSRESEF